ncbi:divergent PAP2 family protein [Paenibacillus sp.]|uniref:divergent PAP2 family protein n=1 Tax=Paenibacillus sp. TaxID=58172 RepID=UPI002D33F48C|nr:divergent PAP2 family protein [Paenibacillus sp.]HZG57095.1 divergent PAP2 family protein [Paenibacillus sp.]
MNRAIITGLSSIAAAQTLKLPLEYWSKGEWKWSTLFRTGGMPSSHSAGVSSLATYIALKKGVSAVDFAISALFGLIVMYDAMGIRRHAGEMAVELNELDARVEKLADHHPGTYHREKRAELKEELGHMPREVVAGALLGVAAGALSYALEQRK